MSTNPFFSIVVVRFLPRLRWSCFDIGFELKDTPCMTATGWKLGILWHHSPRDKYSPQGRKVLSVWLWLARIHLLHALSFRTRASLSASRSWLASQVSPTRQHLSTVHSWACFLEILQILLNLPEVRTVFTSGLAGLTILKWNQIGARFLLNCRRF